MQTNIIKTILMTTFAVLIFAVSGCAQGHQNGELNQEPPSVEELLRHMDANEDGKLSKKEVKGPLKNDFNKVDLNEDGFLTREEIEKAPRPKGKKRRKN